MYKIWFDSWYLSQTTLLSNQSVSNNTTAIIVSIGIRSYFLYLARVHCNFLFLAISLILSLLILRFGKRLQPTLWLLYRVIDLLSLQLSPRKTPYHALTREIFICALIILFVNYTEKNHRRNEACRNVNSEVQSRLVNSLRVVNFDTLSTNVSQYFIKYFMICFRHCFSSSVFRWN